MRTSPLNDLLTVYADVNGDGGLDEILLSPDDDTINIRLSSDGAPFVIDLPAAGIPKAVASADLNGNGKSDLIVTSHGTDTAIVLLDFDANMVNPSSPDDFKYFAQAHTLDNVGETPTDVVTGNLDDVDGIDFAVGNESTKSVTIMSNDGAGGFVQRQVLPMPVSPVPGTPAGRIQPGPMFVLENVVPGISPLPDVTYQSISIYSQDLTTVTSFLSWFYTDATTNTSVRQPYLWVGTLSTGLEAKEDFPLAKFEIHENQQFVLDAVVREHDGQIANNYFYTEDVLGGPGGPISIGQKEFPSSVITGRQVADIFADGGFALLTFEFEGGSADGFDGTGVAYVHSAVDPTLPRTVRTDNLEWPAGKLMFSMTVKKIDPNQRLLADSIGQNSAAESISENQIQLLLAEAIERLTTAETDVSSLSDVEVQVTDLPGAVLGQAVGNIIYLDRNAAGHGWFVDDTPADDLEFTTIGDQGEEDKMDALSVIMHELGHLLDRDHESKGLMQPTLSVGQRHSDSGNDLLNDAISDDLLQSLASDIERQWIGS